MTRTHYRQELNPVQPGINETDRLALYPVPDGAKLRKDFQVFVRLRGEESWNELSCYEVKVDMHDIREASMAYFDFRGHAEIKIRYAKMDIYKVDIRPLSRNISAHFEEREIRFDLDRPAKLSIEVNGDRFHNLHLFAGDIQEPAASEDGESVIALPGDLKKPVIHRSEELGCRLEKMPKGRTLSFGPGIHYLEECAMRVPSDTNIYIAGGAVIVGTFVCSKTENIKIFGRGVLYLANFERFSGLNAIRLSHAKNVAIEGLHLINPPHYSVYIGGSDKVRIKDVKTFSCEGWSDGFDLMSSSNVTVEDCFLRTSDDCIAIYGRRWDYNGNTENILVQNTVLWADVAHPTNIGGHGDHQNDGNLIQNVTFKNIDILEHHEPQKNYLGCMSINVGDKNTVKNVTYENIRVERFENGKLLDFRILMNEKYNPEAGKKIENILLKNIDYKGSGEHASVIVGYDPERTIENVTIENLTINGKHITDAESGNIRIGPFTQNIVFK